METPRASKITEMRREKSCKQRKVEATKMSIFGFWFLCLTAGWPRLIPKQLEEKNVENNTFASSPATAWWTIVNAIVNI